MHIGTKPQGSIIVLVRHVYCRFLLLFQKFVKHHSTVRNVMRTDYFIGHAPFARVVMVLVV